MRRSELNTIIAEAARFIERMQFKLPPFAFWSLEDWQRNYERYAEICDNQMGWDITDFGSGDFRRVGLLIFVLRNGNFLNPAYKKPYCEKLLIVDEGQLLPYHFHWRKMEDIINRGGGNLMVQLRSIDADERFTDEPVVVRMDGREVVAQPGETLRIRPGESITLQPRQVHQFWAEEGTGTVLLGEVSTVADEAMDNRFYDYTGRIPTLEEDARPSRLIFADYSRLGEPAAWPEAWHHPAGAPAR